MAYKLGSLFDGSGGFPLAGSLCGIAPVWAAEVEPYPIAVTRSRFPSMKHLGDISKINGAEIEPVDIITFGSPCQDLSVAGKRAGLKHGANGDEETTRSGLFMEAVRIIKEMREATNGEYPTFALWENVPGAFSSNKGEDFRIVLEELVKIAEPTAVMPPVPKAGWAYADSYVGDGWSLAYRVFDAQYWGVPQRRRRIHLVVDFRGERAREVLFEREGVRGYFAQSGKEGQGIIGNAQSCAGADDREGENNCVTPWDVQSRRMYTPDGAWPALYSGEGGGHGYVITEPGAGRGLDAVTLEPGIAAREGGRIYEGVSGTLRAEAGDNRMAVAYSIENHPADSRVNIDDSGKVQTPDGAWPALRAGVTPACVYEWHNQDSRVTGPIDVACTLNTNTGGREGHLVMEPYPIHDQATRFSGKRGAKQDGKGNGLGVGEPGDPMNTLTSGDRHVVAYATDVGFFNTQEEISPTLLARMYKDPHPATYPEDAGRYIVRRLTPTECARLQGFADRWGHIEQKDTFTPEEFQFWLEVRNTHAVINGRKVQEYTEKQMLAWYNKLHTDSAEYKMWGNGIALPPALYCMQGMVEALRTAEEDEVWML